MQIQSIALAALAQADQDFEKAAARLSQAAAQLAPTAASDSVSLSDAAVELIQSQAAFEVALELAKTSDEIVERTLDVLL